MLRRNLDMPGRILDMLQRSLDMPGRILDMLQRSLDVLKCSRCVLGRNLDMLGRLTLHAKPRVLPNYLRNSMCCAFVAG